MAAYEDMIQSWLSERAQARAMGAAPAPAPASAAPAAPAVAPTTVSARMGAQLPALGRFARGVGSLFGKTVPFAAPAIAGVSEVTGIAESAADPEQSKVQTAQRTAESISRLAGMGAGAGLGLVGGGPWGAVAGGALGYAIPQGAFALRDMVRNWNTPASTTPTAAASTTPTAAAPLPAPVVSFASGAQGGFTPPTATPIRGYGANNQPYQPVTSTVGPDGTIRITGTGSPSTGGTGGTGGVSYLRKMLDVVLFKRRSVAAMLHSFMPEIQKPRYLTGHRPIEGLFHERSGRLHLQIHNPDRQVVAWVRAEGDVEAERDIAELPPRSH